MTDSDCKPIKRCKKPITAKRCEPIKACTASESTCLRSIQSFFICTYPVNSSLPRLQLRFRNLHKPCSHKTSPIFDHSLSNYGIVIARNL